MKDNLKTKVYDYFPDLRYKILTEQDSFCTIMNHECVRKVWHEGRCELSHSSVSEFYRHRVSFYTIGTLTKVFTTTYLQVTVTCK